MLNFSLLFEREEEPASLVAHVEKKRAASKPVSMLTVAFCLAFGETHMRHI